MVIQGSNDVPLNVYIVASGKPAPLEGSMISLVVKAGARKIVKSASVIGTGLVSTICVRYKGLHIVVSEC
jgi:hypothetical protein